MNNLRLLYRGKCPSCNNNTIIKQIDNGSVSALYEYIKGKWVNTDNNPTQETALTIYYCLNCKYERITGSIDIN